MKHKLINYIRGWSGMRFVRLALGVIILVQGLVAAEMLSVVLGAGFAGMALVNIGCNGACSVHTTTTTNNKNEPDFEEVVIKK